jgi:hypothetical protein
MRLRASGRAVAVTKTASSASPADALAALEPGSCAAPAPAQQASRAAAAAGRMEESKGRRPQESAAEETKRMR